jgi:hypothetical protein
MNKDSIESMIYKRDNPTSAPIFYSILSSQDTPQNNYKDIALRALCKGFVLGAAGSTFYFIYENRDRIRKLLNFQGTQQESQD